MMNWEETGNKLKGEYVSGCVEEISVDWRGRPCKPNKHGGMTSAAFVLGLQAFEMMAIAAVGNNLITYVFSEMHFPLSKSANIVTNFIGTVFLLSLLGGFLSDSYLGSFCTMLIFGFVELMGFILLAVQAHIPQLRPPHCNMGIAGEPCLEVKGYEAWIFFLALCLVALGSGCLKPNIISLGADQFQKDDTEQSKKLSTYFNCAYFAFCTGELFALTVLVWVQTQSGMDVGFAVSAAAMAVGLISLLSGTLVYRNKPTRGSIFTPIAQVFVAAITKRKQICPSNSDMLHGNQNIEASAASPNLRNLLHTEKFRFLDKACIKIQDGSRKSESPWRLCSVTQVEQVKIIISVVPIFACTIIFNTILAQLQTFSVQQGSSMNKHLTKNFQIPPASLQSIPYIMLIFVVPLYETAFVPIARKVTGRDSGISPLQRIGIGLFIATFSMVSAALVENKRRNSALNSNKTLSIFWIAPQFLIFGLSEMFTAVGLIEFFYKQSLEGMQSFLTAMTYCSYSFGFYLSSVLVSLVNNITSSSSSSGGGWLSENDLNKDRLDLFYWLLVGLSLMNFFNYLFWSSWYSYNPTFSRPSPTHDQQDHSSKQIEAYSNTAP
ncbi:protein NRT1/ PTR FAMILY 4.4-like isoform X1 [Rhododendron vialii]|uniref:protein NRT1/ PTR FAMILY 4.4-like isoform X1 n=2 Tax=Rhododendron vialii TaxID=182163 RepID=UPI00265DB38F|nr:protein NRT1/ PTR FAMILY 4.4-like isoform X1 [Rhododendron vialii]XP_058201924.1 protein NRT1/ PTR FAMILY 4.4-like isoform X1 [Rhododendron vialii]